ncbi:MAG: peptidase U32 family protein [Nanoarchaeota archaeon]
MRPEILAPVGNEIMLRTAIAAGADAVYLGVKGMNMRATARNFTADDLSWIVEECHAEDVKVYLTMNTIVYEDELEMIDRMLATAKEAGIDAIICWDLSIIEKARAVGHEIHISTQASIANSASAEYFRKLGASRCVLARECTLDQLKEIRKNTGIGIEVFAHGAMCVSVSGRCFISEHLYGKSANRGECIQPCRRAYDTTLLINDKEEDKELILGNDYVMSPKDLCTLPFLDKLAPHVDSLKIEGRARSPEYVKTVVRVYREALDAIERKTFTKTFVKGKMQELSTVYTRGFSDGFYMGKPINEYTNGYGSKATKRKHTLGKVLNYYKKIGVAEIQITANSVRTGDTILFLGNKTGTLEQVVGSIQTGDAEVDEASKGDLIGVKVDSVVRKNDAVYLWK